MSPCCKIAPPSKPAARPEGQLAEARRGFRMPKGGRVIIQDGLRTLRAGQRIRWGVTPAKLERGESRQAVLSLDGQSLRLEILAPGRPPGALRLATRRGAPYNSRPAPAQAAALLNI